MENIESEKRKRARKGRLRVMEKKEKRGLKMGGMRADGWEGEGKERKGG